MYSGIHAAARAEQPAIIMAKTGETVTYAELEARENRLAHFFRTKGLKRLDHYAVFMENNARYIECCGAGERAGLYYTCANSFLTPDELSYIVNNCRARVLITSQEKRDTALAALKSCPNVELCLIVDGPGDGERVLNLDEATKAFRSTPITDEALGAAMLYSSGTTGEPKGILAAVARTAAGQKAAITGFYGTTVGISGGDDLPVSRAVVSFRPASSHQSSNSQRWNGDRDGEVRSRILSATRREV